MERVRGLPCLVIYLAPPCLGDVVAHHAGIGRGMGQKADDDTCVPLCQGHHMEWHAMCGYFKGWDKARRREWAEWAIQETRSILEVGDAD